MRTTDFDQCQKYKASASADPCNLTSHFVEWIHLSSQTALIQQCIGRLFRTLNVQADLEEDGMKQGKSQEDALVIANALFQQHKRRLHTWTSPDGQHQKQIDYILCSQRWRSSTEPAKTRVGADCGSDHELLIAKFRLKLKKVRKTTRPFRYDLNQIPYDYTVDVRNRCKGLDLIDREPDELWMEVHDIVQETGINCQLSSGHRTGKGQFSFQSLRKAIPKNAQTTI